MYWCQGCGLSTFCQTNIWWCSQPNCSSCLLLLGFVRSSAVMLASSLSSWCRFYVSLRYSNGRRCATVGRRTDPVGNVSVVAGATNGDWLWRPCVRSLCVQFCLVWSLWCAAAVCNSSCGLTSVDVIIHDLNVAVETASAAACLMIADFSVVLSVQTSEARHNCMTSNVGL